jgi:hypothetical protein
MIERMAGESDSQYAERCKRVTTIRRENMRKLRRAIRREDERRAALKMAGPFNMIRGIEKNAPGV